jgi:competence protein ComGF
MQTPDGFARSRPDTHAGFTLIELMVSFSALLVVLLGFSRMLISSHMASATTHDGHLVTFLLEVELEYASHGRLIFDNQQSHETALPGSSTSKALPGC